MKTRLHFLIAASALAAAASFAQTPSDADAAMQARAKMDSLEQALERTVFSPAEQKAWRDCERNKREFLQRGRKADPAFAETDSLLRSAKLGTDSPDDPKVEKLMERKYQLEQKLEDAYHADAEGKRCLEVADQRQSKLQAALAANVDYQKWKRQAEAAHAAPAPL